MILSLSTLMQRYMMKYSEAQRLLKKLGATFEKPRRRGSHGRVKLNGKFSVFPNHGSHEIPTGTWEKIKKDLGLK